MSKEQFDEEFKHVFEALELEKLRVMSGSTGRETVEQRITYIHKQFVYEVRELRSRLEQCKLY